MENTPVAAEEVRDDRPTAEEAGHTEELLIEEISIDGMCGVY
jgi:mycofactocin precursor